MKITKLIGVLKTGGKFWLKALLLGVAAGVEHASVLRQLSCKTVVDIGANKGQFARLARHCFPGAKIYSLEPLPGPAKIFRKLFEGDNSIFLNEAAVGPDDCQLEMHVSARNDSSSLLPITSMQEKIFPGTNEVETVNVTVAPLQRFLNESDIVCPAMLKLDVQGFELEALKGSATILHCFEWIYCECSFIELYKEQKLADDVIIWLGTNNYRLMGIYNLTYDSNGVAVQGDFLFKKNV